MTAELPDHYFRVRENGAVVFRISTENRQRRIEMDEIATVNVRNGTIKPHGDVTLTKADIQAIEAWITERQAQLAAREVDDILNLTTQWAQSRATDEQLEAVTDRLLLTMHDLRTVLVRKKADRLGKSG
jgi:hypothetical protein